MAVEKLFREIGQKYLIQASQSKDAEARSYFEKAASESYGGNLDAAENYAALGQEALHSSRSLRNNNTTLNNEIVPRILEELKALGIEGEITEDFLDKIVTRTEDVPYSEPVEYEQEVGEDQAEADFVPLTLKQNLYARARLRLVDDPNALELSLANALGSVFPEEAREEGGLKKLTVRFHAQWRDIEERIRGNIVYLTGTKDTQLPISEEALLTITQEKATHGFFQWLNSVEVYRGKTFDEVLELTHAGRKREVENKKEPESLDLAFSDEEIYFLAKSIQEKAGGELGQRDAARISKIRDQYGMDLTDQLDDESIERMKSQIKRKLVIEDIVLYEGQVTDDARYITGLLFGSFLPGERSKLLEETS